MAENTKIQWCDHTFNPWIGCSQISPACDNCYAKAWDRRFAVSGHAMHWGAGVARKRTSEANWRLPLKWDKHAALMQSAWARGIDLHGGDEAACIAAGFIKPVRPKVFCASLADVFDNEVPSQWRADLFNLIESTPKLDWLLLTKRIGNVEKMVPEATDLIDYGEGWQSMWGQGVWPENVWLGITICNQAEADRDIPKLLTVPAAKLFLSMEPLLGPVDLQKSCSIKCPNNGALNGIDWVIVGGESGPNARPMHPDWARSLRNQCQSTSVPYLFKQWGEWKPICQMEETDHRRLYKPNVKALPHEDQCNLDDIYGRTCTVPYTVVHLDGSTHDITEPNAFIVGAMQTFKIGKKSAGRLLDGREWNEVPK